MRIGRRLFRKIFSVSWVLAAAESTRQASAEMTSENFSSASSIFNSIEAEFEASRNLNVELVKNFFDELMKFENGEAAVKEFTWQFGIGEETRHIVEDKECRKVYLVDFKKCRKYLDNFLSQQD